MTLSQRIDAGLNGDYVGLNNGFDRINDYIYGVQKSCMMLVGGISGTYKTTLVNFMLLNALIDADKKNIAIDVIYCSYEISELETKMNWLSNIIYQKHNVIIPPEIIKGFGKNRLTIEQKKLVDKEIPTIEALMKKIIFIWEPLTPNQLKIFLTKYYSKQGSLVKKEGIEDKVFVKHDVNKYTLLVVDHILLCSQEGASSEKEMLDTLAKMIIPFTRIQGMSSFLVSQFNDGLNSIDRAKMKGIDLSPQRTDFKGSRGPYEAADIVLGIMCPFDMDLETCLGYDVEELGNLFLMLKIVKNRLGASNRAIGIMADPKSGTFKELSPNK